MITLSDGSVFLKGRVVRTNVCVESGRIKFIGRRVVGERVDCKGLIVLPGLIDVHVHFREPGYEWKEDILSGSLAAIRGGITMVGDMPNNRPPVIDERAVLKKRKLGEKKCKVNLLIYAAITESNVDGVKDLEKIVDGFKVFMSSSFGDLLLSYDSIEKIMEMNLKKPVIFHAEDRDLLLQGKPWEAEVSAVNTVLRMMKKTRTKGKIHVTHISTGEAGLILSRNKKDNLTFDTCPHYLFLSSCDNGLFKVNPSLKGENDVKLLRELLFSKGIDIVASDHAPHTLEEKRSDNPPPGFPGVETTVPLLLTLIKGRLGLLSRVMNESPSKLLGIPNYGKIVVGNKANLTVIDPNTTQVLTSERVVSKCGWTPFEGFVCKGKVVYTVINGIVYDAENLEVVVDESER